MNKNIKIALLAVFFGLFACNAPIGVQLTASVEPSPLPSTPTDEPTPTVVPTPVSLDSEAGVRALQVGSNLPLTAVIAVPTQPDVTIYAGAWGQGVYRSTDQGRTWIHVGDGTGQVTALAAEALDPPVLLVGTADRGVLRLTDAPGPDAVVPIGLTYADVRSVAIDPGHPTHLYAGTTGGLYHSPDDGDTWRFLGLADDEVDAIALADDTGTIYAGTAAHGIWISDDLGATWAPFGLASTGVNSLIGMHGGLPVLYAATDGRGVARIALKGSGKQRSGLGPGVGPTSQSGIVGQAGTAVAGGPYGGTVTDLKMDPLTPTTLYAATEYGVFKSTDNGDNWRLTSLSSVDVYALAIDPANPSIIFAGTRGQGLYRSLDGGETWARSADPEISDVIVYSLAVDPSAPNIIYAGGRRANVEGFATGDWGGGVFKSVDAGSTWQPVNAGLPETWVYSLAIDPRSPGVVYAGTHSMGVFKTTDGAATWQSQSEGLISRYHLSQDDLKIRSLAMNPGNPDQLIAGTWGGGSVFTTQDGGVTWTYAGKGAEPTHVRVVAYNPLQPDVIYAGQREGGLLTKKLSEAGSLWQPLPAQVQGTWGEFSVVLAVAINPDGRTMFLGVEGAGVLRSLDGGATWQIVDNGLLAVPVTAIAADPGDASHLFAATDGAGVFHSNDGGESWSQHTWSTAWDWGLAMAVDPAGGRLYVATEANGLQSIDIGGPTGLP